MPSWSQYYSISLPQFNRALHLHPAWYSTDSQTCRRASFGFVGDVTNSEALSVKCRQRMCRDNSYALYLELGVGLCETI